MANKTLTEAEFLKEVERIRKQHPPSPPIGKTSNEALDRVFGIFKDDPTFERVVRYSEERRLREREEAEREADTPEQEA